MTKETRSQLLKCLAGRTVLVTGGTGSFGQTLVQLCAAQSRAKQIIVYSRDEQKHVRMQRAFKDPRIRYFVGDVRDLERLREAMRGVDYVFNAAALKHVHFTEIHPMESVATNVLGANNVCKAAIEAGVKTLVTLSTDKAVEPVNAMGMSKALQERIVASHAKAGMRVGIVRYGNVLASNGSVVPYFGDLLKSGAAVLPITDHRMTRFVLTLGDSVDLVLYALNRCQHGETYVLDLPAFRIWDVAEVMIRLFSKPVKIKETGIRPGEKLHETLISSEEMRRAVRKNGFWVIRPYRSSDELFKPSRSEHGFTSNTTKILTRGEIAQLLTKENCIPAKSA